jgi:hypothetical protein
MACLRLKAALAGVAGGLIGIGVLGRLQIVNCTCLKCGNLSVPRCLRLQAELKLVADVVMVGEVGVVLRWWLWVGPRAEGATVGVA